jgi:Family of unknown function (DUF6504)
MRRYDEEIDVRRGLVAGQEAPAQFLWRHRLWVVRDIISHWVETGAWWDQPGVSALFGRAGGATDAGTSADGGGGGALEPGRAVAERPSGGGADGGVGSARCSDLLGERELWRVEAVRGQQGAGVFDLAFDWSLGQWRLVGCVD